MKGSSVVSLAWLGLGCAVSVTAPAQHWPARPIRLVVPNAPGGASDTVARWIADKLSPAPGQQILVENRAGAGGRLAGEFVAELPPGGTAEGVVTRLAGEIAARMPAPEVRKIFEAQGAEVAVTGPDELGRIIAAEIGKWTAIVQRAGIEGE